MIWKIYFWVLAVLIVLSLLSGVIMTPGLFTNIYDLINLGLMVIGLIGIFIYAFKRTHAFRVFWLVFLVVSLLYQLLYSFVLDQQYGAASAANILEGLYTFVPLIPMYIGLALYVFKRPRTSAHS
jgi:hypothetical protein